MLRIDPLMPWALAALLPLSFACGDDDDSNGGVDAGMPMADMGPEDMGSMPGNIVETAQTAGLSSLFNAATTAGLADVLSGPGPFTVFAPTNDAFTALGADAPTDPGLLANVLLHHVVAGEQDSTAVLGASSFTTAANTSIAVDGSATPATIGGAPLSGTLDVEASNGIVHVIDAVMIPPRIDQAVGATAELATLGMAVGAASMDVQNVLSGAGPITVFAPVNDAFTGIDLSTLSTEQVDKILTYHVVPGQTLSSDLSDGMTITTAQGGTLTVNVDSNGAVTLTDSTGTAVPVQTTDIRLLNGVVHLIGGVLTPPDNIVELAESAGLSSLLAAATTAGLADTLATDGPFTVFAPTNEAFTALGNDAPTDPGLLANILLNHVVPGEQLSSAVLMADEFITAAKTSIAVDSTATPPTVGGAPLSGILDQSASNGVVHVIDAVIIPPTIAEAAAALDNLTTLNTAVGAADPGVAQTLSGPGPITVFAPVDAAFANIDVGGLVGNQARLTDILTYHVAIGQALSTSLTNGQVIPMANNGSVTVNIDAAGAVTLTDGLGNQVNVIETDIRLRNGVVHLIDGVIFPGHIVEQAISAQLTTLVDAVIGAELDGVLRTPGPFTVFAPTNQAFTDLGVDLSVVNGDVVSNILVHHVVAGRFDSTAILGGQNLTSLANLGLAVDAAATPATIGGADLSASFDVGASNGIVHVMDGVIVPPTITDVAGAVPDLSTLVQALNQANPGTREAVNPSTLTGADPVTVFAPLNNAFTGQNIDPLNTDPAILDAVLGYHVIPGQVLEGDLLPNQMVMTVTNQPLTINYNPADGSITIIDAQGQPANVDVSLRDIRTRSGAVHVIDRVLIPTP